MTLLRQTFASASQVATKSTPLSATPATRPSRTLCLTALLTVLAFCFPALAQESQHIVGMPQSESQAESQAAKTDGYGTSVYADTLVHLAPHAPVPFTDSPRRSTQPDQQLQSDQQLQPDQMHLSGQGIRDDFDNNVPTAWWMYTGQTPAQVSAIVTNDQARIIDLEVDSVSPFTLTVTLVKNSGTYAKGWWWYYGMTIDQVSSTLTANKARLISLKAYDSGGGQIRYAVVMIPNAGVDAKGWWWYVGQSVSSLASLLQTNNARLISVDPYVSGGQTYYTAIMISNTGADKQAWWWYINASGNTLSNAVNQNHARIFYLTGNSDGTLNAIMEGCTTNCSEWWYYYGSSAQGLLNAAVQNGARMVNFDSYPGCGGRCYAGAMINNSNAITTRVGNIIRNNVGGTEGLYLKQVGGGVVASLEDATVFEPASTIKVIANLYSQRKIQLGQASESTPITHYLNGPGSCPNPPIVSGTETLSLAQREMMYHSDNTRTRQITDFFGDANINAYAASIGATNTTINHIIGCGGPTPDTLTLDDAGKIYEGVANQTLLSAKNRGIFYSNMAGRAQFESEGYDWTGLWSTDIPNIINQVAPAGYTAQQKSAYYNSMNLAYKAGNYLFCQNNSCTNVIEHISIAGWFQLPVCTTTGTTFRGYVFGVMFTNEPDSGYFSGKVTAADANFTAAKAELLREQIKSGMTSCLGKSLNTLTWSPADLVFAKTTVAQTTAAQVVTLTNNQLTPATGLAVSVFGDFIMTHNCPATLAVGASCTINVKFRPSVTGERTGAVIIADAAAGEPQTIQLTGTGQ